MTSIILTETYAKCTIIKNLLTKLGNNTSYTCITIGTYLRKIAHLSDIIIDEKPGTVEIKYTNIEMRIEKIKSAIQDASTVLIATDSTPEGEMLAWHICDIFRLDMENTKRLNLFELTQKALAQSLSPSNTDKIDPFKVYEQRTREIIDMLIKYTFSPIAWKKNIPTNATIDRLCIPAIQLIKNKNKNISNNPVVGYNVTAYFTRLTLPFKLNTTIKEKEIIQLFNTLKTCEFKCSVTQPRKAIINPPTPLSMGTLLILSSSELNLSPPETMQHAQYLYEHGCITHPYTNTNKYSSDFIITVKNRIENTYGILHKKYLNTHIDNIQLDDDNDNDNNKKEQAIRPTNITLIAKDLRKIHDDIHPKAIHLYDLIWRNTLQSCMSSAHKYTVVASINIPNTKYSFTYKSICSTFKGWESVENKIVGGEEGYNYLQNLNTEIPIDFECVNAKFAITNSATPYTEKEFIQKLLDIIPPKCIPQIFDKLKTHKFLKKGRFEGHSITQNEYTMATDSTSIYENITTQCCDALTNCILLEPTGENVLEIIESKYDAFFSTEMEQKIANVANKTEIWSEICIQCYTELVKNKLINISENRTVSSFSYRLDDKHTVIEGKFGLCIKTTDEDNQTKFLKIKPELTLDDFNNASTPLTLNDVLNKETNSNITPPIMTLGKHAGFPLLIKKGTYGYYAEWGKNRVPLKNTGDSNVASLTYPDVYRLIEARDKMGGKAPPGIVRQVNNNLSIRVGKVGKEDYLMYKRPKIKTPSFFSLSGFPGNYKSAPNTKIIEWVNEKYNISV